MSRQLNLFGQLLVLCLTIFEHLSALLQDLFFFAQSSVGCLFAAGRRRVVGRVITGRRDLLQDVDVVMTCEGARERRRQHMGNDDARPE
jgi:hypothetical protein